MNRKVYLEEIADWDKNAEYYSHDSVMPFRKIMDDEIEEAYGLGKSDFILDAGCGVRGVKHNVVGIDFSFEMLKKAKENNPEGKYILGSVHELPFKPGIFDEVICNGLLHHIKVQGMLNECLDEFYTVLRDGGYLCVFDRAENFIPNFFMALRQPLKLLYNPKSQCSTRNECDFTEGDLLRILARGFHMVERRYVVSLPFQFMVIATNVVHYNLGFSIARKLQKVTRKMAELIEKHVSFKALCAEQCIKFQKKRGSRR